MKLFAFPEGLSEVAYFKLPHVQTWGRTDDTAYKEQIRQAAALTPDIAGQYDWFVFCIRGTLGESRGKWRRQVPDVENIPKLIVDAFTSLLYPDDNLHYVRGVQVEADWVPDSQEQLEVWIYGQLKRGPGMNEIRCSICDNPVPNPEFAHNYPNFICQSCDGRAVNQRGEPPSHMSAHDHGDNPVYIDGIKCWRRYRFGGYVTMRDNHDCVDIGEFYDKHNAIF